MKRPFSLIEVLIGLSLAAMVLGTLFTSLYETSTMNKRLDEARTEILSRAELQQRLDAIFSHLTPTNHEHPKTSVYLTQKKDTPSILHFTFQAGIDPELAFSGELNGSIVLENQTLFLIVEGKNRDDETPIQPRKALLKQKVEKVAYEFLSFENDFNPMKWDEKASSSPAYIKLTLTLIGKQNEEYVFWVNRPSEGVPIQ